MSPYFSKMPSDIMMNAGDNMTYVLPTFIDPEGLPVSATCSYQGGSLPSFIVFNGTAFELKPLKGVDIGTFEI